MSRTLGQYKNRNIEYIKTLNIIKLFVPQIKSPVRSKILIQCYLAMKFIAISQKMSQGFNFTRECQILFMQTKDTKIVIH